MLTCSIPTSTMDPAVIPPEALPRKADRQSEMLLREYLQVFASSRRILLFMDLADPSWSTVEGPTLENALRSWWGRVSEVIDQAGFEGEVVFYPIDEVKPWQVARLNAAIAAFHRIAPGIPVFGTIDDPSLVRLVHLDKMQVLERVIPWLPPGIAKTKEVQVYGTRFHSKTRSPSNYFRRISWLAFGASLRGSAFVVECGTAAVPFLLSSAGRISAVRSGTSPCCTRGRRGALIPAPPTRVETRPRRSGYPRDLPATRSASRFAGRGPGFHFRGRQTGVGLRRAPCLAGAGLQSRPGAGGALVSESSRRRSDLVPALCRWTYRSGLTEKLARMQGEALTVYLLSSRSRGGSRSVSGLPAEYQRLARNVCSPDGLPAAALQPGHAAGDRAMAQRPWDVAAPACAGHLRRRLSR